MAGSKSEKAMHLRHKVEERTVQLFDCIAGEGAAQSILDSRSSASDEPPEKIAYDISTSIRFERLYKRTRTLNVGMERRKEIPPPIRWHRRVLKTNCHLRSRSQDIFVLA